MKLWDFNDPAGSERRFREVAATMSGDDRAAHLTQVARALGLQEECAEGLEVLDGITDAAPHVRIHIALERGRLLRSTGRPAEALAHFTDAEQLAEKGDRDELRIDAMHMIALMAGPQDQLAVKLAALDLARASDDHRARDWDAPLLTNIGMTHTEAGNHEGALENFKEALAARERIGDIETIHVAQWMIAWSLRNLGRHGEALKMQHALKAELDSDQELDQPLEHETAGQQH